MLSIFRGSLARRAFLTAGLCAVAGLSGLAAPAMAQPATQQITYLLPAPANLPAFAPLMVSGKPSPNRISLIRLGFGPKLLEITIW